MCVIIAVFLNIINEYVESANREMPEHKRHKWRMKEGHFVEMLTRIYVIDLKKMKGHPGIAATIGKIGDQDGVELEVSK